MQEHSSSPEHSARKPIEGVRWLSLSSCALEVLERAQQVNMTGNPIRGLTTGVDALDQASGGLEPGDLVVIAGRPGMLKTTLATRMADHVAQQEALPVMYVNLGANSQAVTMRMLSASSGVPTFDIRQARLEDAQAQALDRAFEAAHSSAFQFIEIRFPTVEKILESVRQFKQFYGGIGLLVVDYLQLIDGVQASRSDHLGFAGRQLKSIAQELGCPVLLVSQLSPDQELRPDQRPQLSDLYGSAALAEDADLVLLNHLDHEPQPDSALTPVLETQIAKNRRGAGGLIRQEYQPATGALAGLRLAQAV